MQLQYLLAESVSLPRLMLKVSCAEGLFLAGIRLLKSQDSAGASSIQQSRGRLYDDSFTQTSFNTEKA